MIKNRKLGHIGLATNDLEKDLKWYVDGLGFELTGKYLLDGRTFYFLKNGNVIYEMYQPETPLPKDAEGKIDHFCFDSQDIEADYQYFKEHGFTFTTDGLVELPSFFENGVRLFKVASPTGEELEFCQIL